MRTYRHDGLTAIHYHSDGSGLADIRVGTDHMLVPFDALLGLVAEFVRSQRIAELEAASRSRVLGLPEASE